MPASRRELGSCGGRRPFRDPLRRPGAQVAVQYFNAPGPLVTGGQHRFDEAAHIEFPFAAQPAMIDRVLEQAPRCGERAIVDLDAANESQRETRHVLVRYAKLY